MNVIINNEPTQVDDRISVARLIAEREAKTAGIAVAVNNAIVRRADWEQHLLNPDDNIIIIKAAYGG
jgi:sulfur carrier protein